MLNTIKKILSVLLIVVMVLTAVPLKSLMDVELPAFDLGIRVSAEDTLNLVGQCGEDIYWSFDNETGHLALTGSGYMYNYNYDSAFENNESIKSLTIGDGIVSIGDDAFRGCTNLQTVTGGKDLEQIGSYAFEGCAIDNIDFAENVHIITDGGFNSCDNITELYFNKEIYLREGAFAGCDGLEKVEFADNAYLYAAFCDCNNLETVIFPEKGKSIQFDLASFFECDKLEELYISEGVTYIYPGHSVGNAGIVIDYKLKVSEDSEYYLLDENGVLYNKDKTNLVYYPALCDNKSLVLPDTVESIFANAFYNASNLESIQLSDSLKTIGKSAFVGSGIKSIIIPDSVTEISDSFSGCDKLRSVVIGSGVKEIGSYSFSSCDNLDSIVVSSANQYYSSDSYGALYNKDKTTLLCYPKANKRENYVMPRSVTKVDSFALSATKYLKNIDLSEKITAIDLSDCINLETVNLPDAMTNINCRNCYNLKLDKLPESLKEIVSFENCYNITIKTIPEGVTRLSHSAFQNCKSIKKFHIGKNVLQKHANGYEYGYYYVFAGCDSLEEITVDKDNTYFTSENGVLYNKDKTKLFHYPSAKTDEVFSIPEGVITISTLAFSNALNLVEVKIPSTLTEIGSSYTNAEYCLNQFLGCLNLEKFSVNDKSESYSVDENGVLYNKSKTTLIAYPIGSGMTSFTIPSTVTEIIQPDCYFGETENLEEILVEEGNTAFSSTDGVLYNADNTKLMAYPHKKQDTRYEILDTATGTYSFGCMFNQHPYLKEVVAPESVTNLRLKNPSSLEKLEILNKDCSLSFYPYNFTSDVMTIYGYKGSKAEDTAKTHNIAFKEIGHTHTHIESIITPATCTEPGVVKYTCECGDSYEEDIPVLGHKGVVTKGSVEPTCTVSGCTEEISCSVCGEVLEKSAIIEATGHTEVREGYKEPTCTENGLTEKFYCSVCGYIFKGHSTIPAEHKWVLDEKASKNTTCTEDGYYLYNCSACGEIKEKTVEAFGHTDSGWVITKEPTCESEGLRISTCKACNEEMSEIILAYGEHKWGDWTVVEEANCEYEGIEAIICANCGEIKEKRITEKLPHNYKNGWQNLIEATCTENGLEIKICRDCLNIQTQTIYAKGHILYWYDEMPATCTSEGFKSYAVCTVCKEDVVKRETIAKLGHEEHFIYGKKATCTENGLTDGLYCSRCDQITKKQYDIPATGHNISEIWTVDIEPTCITEGVKSKHCINCGISVEKATIPAEHIYSGWVVTKAATCVAEGEERTKCKGCDKVVVRTIDRLPHDVVAISPIAPMCTTSGRTAGEQCKNCKAIIKGAEAIQAFGHNLVISYQNWDGRTETVKCSRCNYYETRVIDENTFSVENFRYDGGSESKYTLSWSPVSGVSYYEIIKTDDNGTPVIVASKIKDTSYIVYNETSGWYQVRAYGMVDGVYVYGPMSEIVYGAVLPKAPVINNIKAMCKDIYLSWEPMKNVIGYEIWYKEDDGNYKLAMTTADNYVVITDLDIDVLYSFRVRAFVGSMDNKHYGNLSTAVLQYPTGEHILKNWKVKKRATCCEEGIETAICEICNLEKSRNIPKVSHSEEVKTPAVDATCTQNGYTAKTWCYVCGAILQESKVIPATGHNFKGSECLNCGIDNAVSCSCNCHKGGIMGVIFKLILFFQKLLGQNKVCVCGAYHY